MQNLSLVLNNLKDHQSAIQFCSEAIEINEKTAVKAYFQRSIAYLKMQNVDDAADDAKSAIKLEPQQKNLRTHYDEVKAA